MKSKKTITRPVLLFKRVEFFLKNFGQHVRHYNNVRIFLIVRPGVVENQSGVLSKLIRIFVFSSMNFFLKIILKKKRVNKKKSKQKKSKQKKQTNQW